MNYLLIWFENGTICTAGQESLSKTFKYAYRGKLFTVVPNCLGDVDYLRDQQNQLVGFSLILGEATEQEEAFHAALLAQSQNIKLKDGMLIILIEPKEFEIQCVQAIGSELYRSEDNEFILAIPNWDFGTFGFGLTNTNIPIEW